MTVRLILLIALLVVSVRAQQPVPATQTGKTSFSGTILKDPEGVPLKKVSVQVISEDRQDVNYSGISDADGHFLLEDIQPGRYRVFLEKSGFFEVSHNRRRSSGESISLIAGQKVENFVLHMLPAAVITGRVVDEDGEPMANVEIAVLRYMYVNGHRQLSPERSDRANDVGEYRIGGLNPGQYFVVATPSPEFFGVGQKETVDPAKRDMGYVPTYYPGVLDPSQAGTIELRAGEETPIDFALAPAHTFHIRGTLLRLRSRTGIPGNEGQAAVMLMSKGMGTIFSAAEVDKNGKFDIHGVAPGSYVLTVTSPDSDAPVTNQQTINVNNADVNDLRLEATVPGKIHGRLRFEDGARGDLNGFTVFLQPAEDVASGLGMYDAGAQNFARVMQDGSFELKNVLAGNYRIEVQGDNRTSRDYYLQKVIASGHDVSDSGLPMGAGGSLNVDLVLSKDTGVLQGIVLDRKNEPVRQAVVVALPEGPNRVRRDLYQLGETDQYGRFTLRGLKPGHCTVIAWDYIEDGAYLDPQFVKPYERAGTIVQVGGRQTQEVTLQVQSGGGE